MSPFASVYGCVLVTTYSRLDDTDKNFGSDLPLLCKMHQICSVYSQENYYNCCHQMSDFKATMHQIWFRLGLCPRPHWRSLHRSSDLLAGFKQGCKWDVAARAVLFFSVLRCLPEFSNFPCPQLLLFSYCSLSALSIFWYHQSNFFLWSTCSDLTYWTFQYQHHLCCYFLRAHVLCRPKPFLSCNISLKL